MKLTHPKADIGSRRVGLKLDALRIHFADINVFLLFSDRKSGVSFPPTGAPAKGTFLKFAAPDSLLAFLKVL
jgi:hypothetical protein